MTLSAPCAFCEHVGCNESRFLLEVQKVLTLQHILALSKLADQAMHAPCMGSLMRSRPSGLLEIFTAVEQAKEGMKEIAALGHSFKLGNSWAFAFSLS